MFTSLTASRVRLSLSGTGSWVCSVVRCTDSREPTASPSAEALGYSLSVRFADEDKITLEAKLYMKSSPPIRVILLDIEGTTTPISFVHEVLFPYARAHVKSYLTAHLDSPETIASLAQLRKEQALDTERALDPPALVTDTRAAKINSIVAYVEWLIDRDRKSTGLKALQGEIWKQGYLDGTLRAPLFADVLPALERWRRGGLRVAIFSSGSMLAQKLLFAHTQAGDVTEFIESYFDTTTGPKAAIESYQLIAADLGVKADEILFISDVAAELDAARDAGFQTLLCVRPGNYPQPDHDHRIISSFDEVAW
jgi:enolase-phosphatase E1